ncbi:MAG: polysaccharide pyruvyl transferase family protein [Rikenellaceae bacterium]
MKIGVLTLPLHTNYGGVLQAYALQYSLRSMGHDAFLIDCRIDPRYVNIVKYPIAWCLKAASKIMPPIAKYLHPLELQMLSDKVIIRRNTESFIAKNIQLKHFFSLSFIPKHCFDAIVVGSDQVWRPKYFKPIESAYLDFTRSWDIKRVAYAASFGVEQWEYSPEQHSRCGSLLSHFDSISLRELSGVELCRHHFGREATLVLDPTLLLSPDIYRSLIIHGSSVHVGGGLLVSILDMTDDKCQVVSSLGSHYKTTAFSVNSRVEDRTAPLEERIQPPVEQWLRGFIEADYVVTDSFHAMVFAIIFNKPFVAYANIDRGYTRFYSLLSLLGLESQIITNFDELAVESCFQIEWGGVNKRLEQLREESLNFLRHSLA